MQMAELHYQSTPSYDPASIKARAEELIGSAIDLPDANPQSNALLFFHTGYLVKYKEGSIPAQTAILATDQSTDPAKYANAIQQSWACDDAQDRISASAACRAVTEMMARLLPPVERLHLFHGVLQAFVEITRPHAIVLSHSQQVIAPEKYLDACQNAPILRPGTLNVRFYRISNSEEGDMLMDTRGMEEIGLHDVQCHFRGLDPNDVSRILYDTAVYIAENGAVIQSGHTIEGTEPDSKWTCQFENSLLDPKRELLDLNPGPPYAAGNR